VAFLKMNSPLQVSGRHSISVVTPVYNGEASIAELCRRLSDLLPQIATEYEIILVNDGSRDRSWEIISELSSRFATVRGLNLMRNYGQHNALLCGIRAAKHGVIVTMDDDLQHSPEEIPRLLEQLEQGFDVIYGAPKQEQHGFMRALAGKCHRDGSCQERECVSCFPYAIARSVRRLSDAVCFHRRLADMGDNAFRSGTSRFPAALFRFFNLHFHKAGPPRT
jgi:glycosyltransferase involved in cell wall biosynthesis